MAAMAKRHIAATILDAGRPEPGTLSLKILVVPPKSRTARPAPRTGHGPDMERSLFWSWVLFKSFRSLLASTLSAKWARPGGLLHIEK